MSNCVRIFAFLSCSDFPSDLRRTTQRAYLASAENISSLLWKAAFARLTIPETWRSASEAGWKNRVCLRLCVGNWFPPPLPRWWIVCDALSAENCFSYQDEIWMRAASPKQQRAKFEACKMCIERGWRWKTKEQRASRDLYLRTHS
jgi:hypothetical protein